MSGIEHDEKSKSSIEYDNSESMGLRIPSAKQSIEFASKLLRRKIPQAGHLMTPRRLWMHTVPTMECDVVIMFPSGTLDDVLMWFLSKLKSAGGMGLNIHVRQHGSTENYLFYITAPFNVLLKCAEELHLPKRVIPEYGGGLKEFVQLEGNIFQGYENKEHFFTMPERQWLILRLLETLRASAGDHIGDFELVVGQAIVPICLSKGVIAQIFPLHDTPQLKHMRMCWVRAFFHNQPIDDICEYFGAKIAMYFAWLGHFTTALIVPAVIGFIFWVGFGHGDQCSEDVGFVLFSFFNVIWFSVYIETWKRYSAELAYKWGTLDQRDELLTEPRPLFTGTLQISPVTGRLEPTYPAWKRNIFRYVISIPVIVICITIVFIVMIVSFKIQDWWDNAIIVHEYPFFLSFLPKILLAVVISVMDEAYFKVARWLNDQENYRLDTKYENNLIIKVSMFQFVNSFISLFYIAFYLQDQERLKVQLAVLLITRQIICNLKESALPYLIEQFRLAKLCFDMFGALSPTEPDMKFKTEDDVEYIQSKSSNTNRAISQAELESTLFKYEGTFSEHLEMFIQLGYVVLFSSAFPMAALIAMLNNFLEIRSDAFKLCFIYQRPFIQRVANIGMWQNIMEVMGFVAVLVNCALIALSGQVHRMFPDMSKTQTILLIVALEHIMLAIRFVISCAIPDLPEWVATEVAKMEFARREALNHVSSVSLTPPSIIPSSTVPASAVSVGRFVVSSSDNEEKSENQIDIGSNRFVVSSDLDFTNVNPDIVENPALPVTSVVKEKDVAIDRINFKLSSPTPRFYKDTFAPLSSMQLTENWVKCTSQHFDNHATINTEMGADWSKTMKQQPSLKSGLSYRSSSCMPLVAQKNLCSPSSLFHSPLHIQMKDGFKTVDNRLDSTGSDSSSVAEESGSLTDPSEKKGKLKPTFIKRARSVAMFSLKLKERRAKNALKEAEKLKEKQSPRMEQVTTVGGELSCVPIEMLISVDDLQKQQKRISSSGSRINTPTTSAFFDKYQ